MKKCIVFLALLILFELGVGAYAVEPRVIRANPTLSFDGTTAICSVVCTGQLSYDQVEATLTLYRGNTYVDSWSDSGKYSVSIKEKCNVSSGVQYKLVLIWSVNGKDQPSITKSGVCP